MNLLIAPNAYKGSLTAFEIAHIIANSFQKAWPEANLMQLPVADGGDGTAQVLSYHLGGIRKDIHVVNPLGRPITAPIYITAHKTAIIEMADASGLRLLQKNEYAPIKASTFGTGQLIKAALDEGCKRLIIGIGGSATNDCGIGLLSSLGAKFIDTKGNHCQKITELAAIDISQLDPRLQECEIIVPSDVDNPLVGEHGAAHVFGPQKGASAAMIQKLSMAHLNFANLIKQKLQISVHHMPHTGAAGGTGAGLFGILGAQLVRGSTFILDELDFDKYLQEADLVITGEGNIDHQSDAGKAPFEVAQRARKASKPVIAIAGGIELAAHNTDYDAVFSICNAPISLEEAIQHAPKLLLAQSQQIAQLLKLGANIK